MLKCAVQVLALILLAASFRLPSAQEQPRAATASPGKPASSAGPGVMTSASVWEAAAVQLSLPTTARAAPPYGPLNLFVGDKLYSFKEGTIVEVVGRKSYGGFSGSQMWLEVVPVGTDTTSPRKPVWILGGTLKADSILPDRVTAVRLAVDQAGR